MREKSSNALFYTGLILIAIGAFGLTFAAFFALIGLPIFILGLILILLSKKSWKKKLIPIGLFVIGICAFWPIWTSVNSVGPEDFLIPVNYRGKVNIIYKKGCGIQPDQTEDGLVYSIPESGILVINSEQDYGFIEHNYYLIDEKGNRTEVPKMDVRDFNEDWSYEQNPNEPPRDQLGVFHSGRTGSTGTATVNGEVVNPNGQYTFKEFYISNYNELTDRFDFQYERSFDSKRDSILMNCK